MFRACALFCPCIASPLLVRYYPHVLSNSCNCLAPPHFPESLHGMFYPSVYLRSTHSLYRHEFVFFDSVLYSCWYSCPEIPVLKFLVPVSCSLQSVSCHPVISVHLVVCLFICIFIIFCYPSSVSILFCIYLCHWIPWFWLPFCVLADYPLRLTFLYFSLHLISCASTLDCLTLFLDIPY